LILSNFAELKQPNQPVGVYLSAKTTQTPKNSPGSKRILVSSLFMQKSNLPLLVLDLDGTFGYWDEHKCFITSDRHLQLMQALSSNFRLVAVCQNHSKSTVKQLLN
jgi:hypothetical protein